MTTLFGNTAVEERQGRGSCQFSVALDADKPVWDQGAALMVVARMGHGVDPCTTARELVEKGFAALRS